jgi:protoporphyrinogen oxidase
LEDLEKCKEIDNSTFKSYVKSSLGAAICDRFVIPYNEKLYACNLDELESDSMGRFFPKMVSFDELRDSKKSKSYNDTFIYPTGGSYEYIKSILKRVDESKIQLNTTISSIDYDDKIVTTNSGEKIQFENLVSTIPFKNLLKLSNRKFDNLSSNKVAVFNLGFDKGTSIKTHWRYFPGSEVFYRVGFYNNILGHEKMSLYVEIGLSETQLIDEGVLLKMVLKDLERVNIVDTHDLVDYQFLVMNPAYVHITKESKQLYNSWCLDYNKLGIYSIGRYGSWTYCSIEDNIVDAKNLANVLEN